MSRIKRELKVGNNNLNSYFPARTSIAKEGDFDWDIAKAAVIRNLYRKAVNKKILPKSSGESVDKESYAITLFEEKCRKDFEERLDEMELWQYIKEMYFNREALYGIAPEALLFKLTPLTGSSAQHRLADMFSSMMRGRYLEKIPTETSNFLEAQVLTSLRSESILTTLESGAQRLSKGINEKAYLPFLSDSFNKDLAFLSTQPKYLLQQLENLLRLYAYLYTAQLALNIKGLDNEPTAKPLYFIMENESASKERTDLLVHGHRAVKNFLPYIFPYLSMSESLQQVDKANNEHRIPLWELAQSLTGDDTQALREYAKEFAENRFEGDDFSFSYDESNDSPRYWLDVLLEEAVSQFDKKKSRAAAQDKFIKTTEAELCSSFVKSRGQVGQVLIMNQDYISLITNVAIGKREKLRFGELLSEFNTRGIYFDKQSQKALVRFYERVGNVERMSDSGDAVYVRKTL